MDKTERRRLVIRQFAAASAQLFTLIFQNGKPAGHHMTEDKYANTGNDTQAVSFNENEKAGAQASSSQHNGTAASSAATTKRKGKKKTFLETEETTILWKDRKRHLGLPLSFTRYEVDENRFTSRIGFFSTTTNETLLYRIMDLKLSRTLWQKMFGVGTITLYSADKSHSSFELKNIKKPDKVRRFLSNLVEQERDKRRITGRELFGVAGDGGFDMPDLDGDGFPG